MNLFLWICFADLLFWKHRICFCEFVFVNLFWRWVYYNVGPRCGVFGPRDFATCKGYVHFHPRVNAKSALCCELAVVHVALLCCAVLFYFGAIYFECLCVECFLPLQIVVHCVFIFTLLLRCTVLFYFVTIYFECLCVQYFLSLSSLWTNLWGVSVPRGVLFELYG